MNKKIKKIIIFSISILTVIFIILACLHYYVTNKISRLYQKSLKYNYLISSDVPGCSNNQYNKTCLTDISNYVAKGINLKLNFLDKTSDDIKTSLEEANSNLNHYYPIKTINSLNYSIDKMVILEEKYIISNKADAQKIYLQLQALDNYKIINYYINKNWAVITVVNDNTDSANILLKKINNSWKVIAGPGTDFNSISNLEIPSLIFQHLQNITSSTLIIFPNIMSTNNLQTSSTVNNMSDQTLANLKLSDKLPYDGEFFSIASDYINNAPGYIISVYYSSDDDKKTNYTNANKWLSDNGIDINSSILKYNYILQATVE